MKIYNVSIFVISNYEILTNEIFSFFDEQEARKKMEALIIDEFAYVKSNYVYNDGTPLELNLAKVIKEKSYGDCFEIGEKMNFNRNSTHINLSVEEKPIYLLNEVYNTEASGLKFTQKKFTNILQLLREAQNNINKFCDDMGFIEEDRYEHDWGADNKENEYHVININNYDLKPFLFEDEHCNRLLIKIQIL